MGLAVVIVGALLAAVMGVTVVDQMPHPAMWDSRIDDLARFVENERGMLFEEAVAVDFLTEEEFVREVTTQDAALDDADRAEIEDSSAELRALGLVDSDFDLFEETNELTGGATLAYYDSQNERIAVRGTELTPYLRGTIVHEMTHALQDQHVDLDALQEEAGPDGDFRFRSVVEGDAVNVESAYYDQLSDEEKDAFDEEESTVLAGDGGDESFEPALSAFFGAPYSIGPGFVAVLDAVDGDTGVNEALKTLPASEAAILDASLYYDGADPVAVERPTTPEGAEIIDGGTFGSLSWYIVLASRLDGRDALEFVDGWRGDSYVTYRDGDQVCVTARYQPDAQDLGSAESLLREWAAAMPDGSATVTPSGDFVELKSCDPGAAADANSLNDVSQVLLLPQARLEIASQSIAEQGLGFDEAWCFADGIVDSLSIDELQSDEITPDVQQAINDAALACQ